MNNETKANERLVMRVRIKKGSGIFQDHRTGKWPQCVPPNSEYEGEEYKYEAKDLDMEFEGHWDGSTWDCKRDGYGHLKSKGDCGRYGNGSIIVCGGYDAVEIIDA